MIMHKNVHYGTTLDSFLEAEGILEHTQIIALKRSIALQLQDTVKLIDCKCLGSVCLCISKKLVKQLRK